MSTDVRVETFQAQTGLRLGLHNLTSAVRVAPAEDGSATARVEIRGDRGYRDSVTVTYDQRNNRLAVREPAGVSRGGVSVIGGNVVVGGSIFGARGNVLVSGGGRSVSISGGRVVIDGKDVTSLVGNGGGEPVDTSARSITIVVPTGTDTGIDDCAEADLADLGGRVRASLTGEGTLRARGAAGAKLDLSGASRVAIEQSTGELDIALSGASQVTLSGDFGDVDLDISGASEVNGTGAFGHVSGDISGASAVRISQASGNSVRSSGASSVYIDSPVGRRSGGHGCWDF